MATGVSRISDDRHYSASAQQNEGQTCAGDHGTHVGALVAGFENGPAKDAEIVSGELHRLQSMQRTTTARPYIWASHSLCA